MYCRRPLLFKRFFTWIIDKRLCPTHDLVQNWPVEMKIQEKLIKNNYRTMDQSGLDFYLIVPLRWIHDLTSVTTIKHKWINLPLLRSWWRKVHVCVTCLVGRCEHANMQTKPRIVGATHKWSKGRFCSLLTCFRVASFSQKIDCSMIINVNYLFCLAFEWCWIGILVVYHYINGAKGLLHLFGKLSMTRFISLDQGW